MKDCLSSVFNLEIRKVLYRQEIIGTGTLIGEKNSDIIPNIVLGKSILKPQGVAVSMFPHTAHVECVIMMTNSGFKGK